MNLEIKDVKTELSNEDLNYISEEFFKTTIRNAFCNSISNKCAFKHIVVNNTVVGYLIISLSKFRIEKERDEDFDEFKYFSVHLNLIYIIEKYRYNKIGKTTMGIIKNIAKSISNFTGCRFITLDAIEEKIPWYKSLGFTNTNIKSNAEATTLMFCDLRDWQAYNDYAEEA